MMASAKRCQHVGGNSHRSDGAALSVCAIGLAQRQRRDWRDSFSIIAHFCQNVPARERRSRYPPASRAWTAFSSNNAGYGYSIHRQVQ